MRTRNTSAVNTVQAVALFSSQQINIKTSCFLNSGLLQNFSVYVFWLAYYITDVLIAWG